MGRIAMAAVLGVLSAFSAEAQTVTLSGTVRNPDGSPSGGVPVTIERFPRFDRRPPPAQTIELTSDTNGRFTTALPSDAFLRVTPRPTPASGLVARPLEFDLLSDLDLQLLLHRPVTVAGRLATPENRTLRLEAYDLATGESRSEPLPPDGAFSWSLPASVYSLRVGYFGAPGYGRVNVDARGGDVANVLLPTPGNHAVLDFLPPVAQKISISPADANGVATIRGESGSVDPLATVLMANLQTRQTAIAVSDATGAFSSTLFAPPGSAILVKHDPTGRYLARMDFGGGRPGTTEIPGGTILEIPAPAGTFSTAAQIDFFSASADSIPAFRAFGAGDIGQIVVTGERPAASWNAGQQVKLSGTLTIYSRNLEGITDLSALRTNCSISLGLFFDEQGRNLQLHQQFVSSLLTPTGLPISRFGAGMSHSSGFTLTPLQRQGSRAATAQWSVNVATTNLTPGTYAPTMQCLVDGLQRQTRYFDIFPTTGGGHYGRILRLPPIRIGTTTPTRLTWILGLDDFSGGSRGVVAMEDQQRAGIAANIAMHAPLTLPMRDPRTGALRRFSLEPYVPFLSFGNDRLPDPPKVALKFPSGSLSARITRPDGSVRDLGSAPFVQSRNRSHINRGGQEASGASAHVSDFLQLSAMDPKFEVTFDQYGLHRVVLDGSIEDLDGNVYRGGGTYEIRIARELDLEFGTTPGTPFERGNLFSLALTIQPPLPAEIELTLTLLPGSDRSKAIVRTIRGRANRFGLFSPSQGIELTEAGEYRVDIAATHVDSNGVAWAGFATWGSIVETPGSVLVTRGRRGFDQVNRIQDQWFEVRRSRAGGDHVFFPFHTGDVMWMSDDDPAADIAAVSIQDPLGDFAARVAMLRRPPLETPGLQERTAAGEIPLFSSSLMVEPSLEPDRVTQWGYFYAFAERPGVRVREQITEDMNLNGYWRFSDNYHFQLGNGGFGDQTNDFKFQFGGAVWRDASYRFYGAYASLFVMLPNQDPVGGRVFPPFQGNGGGPSGGPILRLKGKDVDLFFHPTGVRPGSVMQRGETATLAGQLGPTLRGKLEITSISPSGVSRILRGTSNRLGTFYDPSLDFQVRESGRWTLRVRATFEERTSAGQVTAPFPAGDVLGSRNGEFWFYVVEPDAPPLQVDVGSATLTTSPAGVRFVRPADGPVTFIVTPPTALTNLELSTTTTMPGFILEETHAGPFAQASSLTYVYDAQRLAQDFPNLDLHDLDGFAGVDTITISLLLSGTDGSGGRRHYARQIVIQGEELQMPEQTALPPRRRSTR